VATQRLIIGGIPGGGNITPCELWSYSDSADPTSVASGITFSEIGSNSGSFAYDYTGGATGAHYIQDGLTRHHFLLTNEAKKYYAAMQPIGAGFGVQSHIDLKDFADDGYDPSTNKIQGLVLVDTLTTYTGNTPQTGDAYSYLTTNLGLLGASLSAIPKTGFKLASDGLAAVTAWTVNITGSLSGSVGSVTSFGTLVADIWAYVSRTLSDKTGFSLTSAYDPAKTAAQAGDAMTLTSGERTTLANTLEAAILNEGDATALLAAIAAKVEEFLINEGDATATIAAIATACNAAIAAGTVGTSSAVAAAQATQANTKAGDIQTRLPAALTGDGNIKADSLKLNGATPNNLAAGAAMTLTAAYDAAKTAATQASVDALGTPMQSGAEVVLSSVGLDQIPITAPTTVPTTFRQYLVWLTRRFLKKATKDGSELKTYADDGTTVITTQAISDSAGTETQGAAT
jgi:hypothetical protein